MLNEEFLKNYLVQIHCRYANVSLCGYLKDDGFSFPMGMQPDSFTTIGHLIEQGAWGAIKAGAKKFVGELASGLEKHSVRDSVKAYGVPNEISFSLSMDIIPGKDGNPSSYKEILHQIAKLTQAYFNKDGMYETYLYNELSLKDRLKDYNAFDGQLISIQIGDWFSGSGFLITSSNVNYSTITDDEGKPLFLEWSITFEPYRQLTAEELSNLITK